MILTINCPEHAMGEFLRQVAEQYDRGHTFGRHANIDAEWEIEDDVCNDPAAIGAIFGRG